MTLRFPIMRSTQRVKLPEATSRAASSREFELAQKLRQLLARADFAASPMMGTWKL